MMRTFFVLLTFLTAGAVAPAALAMSADLELDHIQPDLRDLPSMQRGWQTYMNYCIGCHSLQFARYERTADDLGVPHEVVQELLNFSGSKIGSHMTNAMDPEMAKQWFGAAPPDLTMVARVRGADWLYTYLRTFYRDESRPLGVNNVTFPNVGMPHVLENVQGIQKMVCAPRPVKTASGAPARDPLQPGTTLMEEECGVLEVEEGTGQLTPEEYDAFVYDLVNFLVYTGEPYKVQRETMGVYVILFLVVLFVFAYLLNREYWKDIEH